MQNLLNRFMTKFCGKVKDFGGNRIALYYGFGYGRVHLRSRGA